MIRIMTNYELGVGDLVLWDSRSYLDIPTHIRIRPFIIVETLQYDYFRIRCVGIVPPFSYITHKQFLTPFAIETW